MFRVAADGSVSDYALGTHADLKGIACHGEATAFVVGAEGLVLSSRDAGVSWDVLDLGVDVDLNALAVAEASPEGAETVWVAGDDGTVLVTEDGGDTWASVSGADGRLTGVATDGAETLAVGEDGRIWALGDDAVEVYEADEALNGVALAAGAAMVVGDGGTWLERAGGWTSIAATSRDLNAVRITSDGHAVAVGDGVVARLDDALEVSTGGPALFGLHLGAHLGQAVGANGTVLVTEDAGDSWTPVEMPTNAVLRGVDDFHSGGHH